jgi:O-methyltransferase involved in polyketide biosynthesis
MHVMTTFDKHISESALLVNESRARNVSLSRDRFAHLWVGESTRALWEAFSREVYPHDAIELGARNRFFLESLAAFTDSVADPVFVNVGAGFTSYPFLLERPCTCIEIDYEHVVAVKRRKIEAWRREEILPARNIEFMAADLARDEDLRRLEEQLASRFAGSPSFILMEGLTYYLAPAGMETLLEIFRKLQTTGSLLAFDFWTPDTREHPTFDRLRRFFSERFGHRESHYNLFDIDRVRAIRGYDPVAHTNVQELERRFLGTTVLQHYDEILPEHYVILKREV